MKNNKLKQQGLTLVELMISIALGLVISAAAIHLFITGHISLNMQKGMGEVQDNANFGLRYLTREIRKTNYGPSGIMNDRAQHGGVVISSAATPLMVSSPGLKFTAANVPVNLPRTITGAVPLSGTGQPSNVQIVSSTAGATAAQSDQLVIQFFADEDGVDCEGNNYAADRYIVQRFFLRPDANANQQGEPNTALSLACEAGSYQTTGNQIIKNNNSGIFGTGSGEILIHRVDHFHFLLGVSNDENTRDKRYISIEDYKKLNTFPRPRINSIQIGLLVRSSDSVGANSAISNAQEFDLLDQKVRVNRQENQSATKFYRQVITQTVAIRNSLIAVNNAGE